MSLCLCVRKNSASSVKSGLEERRLVGRETNEDMGNFASPDRNEIF